MIIEASPIWSPSSVWQINMLEFVFGWDNFLLQTTCDDAGGFKYSAILQLWSLESLWPLKLTSFICIKTL